MSRTDRPAGPRPSPRPSLPLVLRASLSPSDAVAGALRGDDNSEDAEEGPGHGFAGDPGLAKIAAEIDVVRRR